MDFLVKKEKFKEYYADNYTKIQSAEKSFRNIIKLLISNTDDLTQPKIVSRIKQRNECIDKFNLKYRRELEKLKKDYEIKNYITDLIGIRIICLYETDIYRVVDILKANFNVIDSADKTLQLLKKKDSFGYKGFHLDLKLDKERAKLPEYKNICKFQFEVQVRSIVQDAWSEVDHKLKYKKSLSDDLQRRVINLAGLFEMADREFDTIRDLTNKEIEEKAKEEAIKLKEPLEAGSFLNLLRLNFPESVFEDYKIEGFLQEILSLKELTVGDFKKAIEAHLSYIQKYKEYRDDTFGGKMNPYTLIRHVLYINNSRIFQNLIFDMQRDNFNNWMANNTE